MKYDLVLFDLDGTLVNTLEAIAKSGNSAFEELGMKTYSIEYFNNLIGHGVTGIVDKVFDVENYNEKEINKEKVKEVVRKYYKKYFDYNVSLYPEIDKLMDFLEKNHIKKGIVTNKDQELALKTVESRLSRWNFVDIIGADDGKYPRKPHPYGIDRISEELGISKEKVLFVGDMEVDIKTAYNAGTDVIYCEWGFGKGKGEKNIPETIKVGDVNKFIEKIK
ncbi:HAD family hydrolase [Leptotrichia sp. OH3620_COT-345]|uniref:HAD family hydrolase n=1 Tax=Leptotrichia sp. OH3620_COT-345 TaxID=2491048 RepID=UPI000F64EB69|nr:HAD family hydrolase [Leptotrichia sp. OH3620_COT-345]RRD40983.1 HAD family hydrolase [Leptotrichia sp. OH3620_COT-345]